MVGRVICSQMLQRTEKDAIRAGPGSRQVSWKRWHSESQNWTSGAGKGLGGHLGRMFKMVPRSPKHLGSYLRSHPGGWAGRTPVCHPDFSPNNSSLVGFCTSYVWTRNPDALLFYFYVLSWSHWSSPNCSFYRWKHGSTLGTFPKPHSVGDRLDMLKKGEQRPHGNKKERHLIAPPGEHSVLVKPCETKEFMFASQVQLRKTFSLTRDTDMGPHTCLILTKSQTHAHRTLPQIHSHCTAFTLFLANICFLLVWHHVESLSH